MNIYKLKLVLKEFGFLKSILRTRMWNTTVENTKACWNRELEFAIVPAEEGEDKSLVWAEFIVNPEYVKVKRVDENLLAITPSIEDYHDGMETNSYFAVTGSNVVALDYWCNWFESGKNEPGNIGEQLHKLGLSPDHIVHYNVKEEGGNEWHKVVIYKMKGFGLAEYHCVQIDKAARELKAEISGICRGGE